MLKNYSLQVLNTQGTSPIENVTELTGVNDLYYQIGKYVTVPQQWQKGVWRNLGKLVFYKKLPNLLRS